MWRAFTRQAASAAKRAYRGSRSAAGGAAGTQLRTLVSGPQATGLGSTAGLGLMAVAASVAFAPVAFAGSVQERSFIMIKPDGVQRGLVAAIIKRFEDKGYKLVGIKVLVPSEDIARQHYMEHDGKPFYPGLVKFLTSGPVVAMVWEGKEVIKTGRTMIGATGPLASAPGTIRGDYGRDVGRNIIHGSDGVDSAQKEIALWFTPKELAEYEKSAKGWIYELAKLVAKQEAAAAHRSTEVALQRLRKP